MLRRAIPFLAALSFCATAHADVRDVKVGVAGARAEVVIEFDAPPSAAEAGPQADGLIVFASGVSARPRRMETLSAGLVTGVEVREGEGGVEIAVHLAREVVAARARLDGHALRVEVALADAPRAPARGSTTQAPPATSPVVPETAPPPPSAPPPTASVADALVAESAPTPAPAAAVASPSSAPSDEPTQLVRELADADPRLGAEEPARAATPTPANASGGGSGRPAAARDPSRPTVIFAGALTDDDCLAAETAIRADPWDLASLKRYASCQALRGDAAAAETAFRRLLTFTPEDPEAELGLAAVRHEQGFANEAAATYQELLEVAIGDADAARLRALLALAASGR
jgi:hypothetical protein